MPILRCMIFSSHHPWALAFATAAVCSVAPAAPESQPLATPATYQGWKSLCLGNHLIELQVLPDIGGRIIQFKLGSHEFLWVNPQLAGKLPPADGLAENGGWFNIGGDKLWPAPQGWDNDQQWPGPPDAVLDGQPYQLEQLSDKEQAPGQPGATAIRLTSRNDPRSGIRLSRVVRIFANSTRVSFEATMENTDNKPRRWGIWAHTQLDGAKADRSGHNPLMQAWCPMNPQSRFPMGYDVIFGDKKNPSFQPDAARGLMRVQYQYKVGKIGLDSPAGWAATVNGENGAVFVQRYVFEPDKPYPDGSSVEFWLNGTGQIRAYNKDMVMATNAAENPYVFESELLSPFAQLEPGQKYTWRYDWYASHLGGDFPVLDCSESGVIAHPLRAEQDGTQTRLTGRFGVFAPGTLRAEFADVRGVLLATRDLPLMVSPLQPLVLDTRVETPANAASVKLLWVSTHGNARGQLAKADLQRASLVSTGSAADAPPAPPHATPAIEASPGKGNPYYLEMRAPLVPAAFVKLPLGAVRPEGWLRDQLLAQRHGLTGHLDEFVLTDAEWKGGKGFKLWGPPYRYMSNYLEGLVPLAYLLDDAELITKARAYIEWILKSQQPDGWFTTPPTPLPTDGKNEETALNNPEYLCCLLRMLMGYHEVTGDPRVIPLATKYFSYIDTHIAAWPLDVWFGARAMDHAIVAHWLYSKTGDTSLLRTVEKIRRNSYDWGGFFNAFPWHDKLPYDAQHQQIWNKHGKLTHVVALAWAVKFPALAYMQSHDKADLDASFKAMESLDRYHGQLGGRFSGDEHLNGRNPSHGTELCGVIEYMTSLEKLLEISGRVALADQIENLAYNSLPGGITPDCWAHQYDQQTNQVLVSNAKRNWRNNGNSSNLYGLLPNYPCCMANMHHGWPRLTEHLWMATHDRGIAALILAPSRVMAKVGDGTEVTITEDTRYPFDGAIRFRVQTDKNVAFPLYIRIPSWASGATLRWNGGSSKPQAGTIARIERTWNPNDEVMLELPMTVRSETRFNNSAAILRGPLYFALRLPKKYTAIQNHKYQGSFTWSIEPGAPWNLALKLDRDHPERSFTEVVGKPGTYPFADKGDPIYDKASNTCQPFAGDAPVILHGVGRTLPAWTLKKNSADDPPPSPVEASGPDVPLELVPYGCARLRIAEFPVIGSTDVREPPDKPAAARDLRERQ